MSGSWIPRQTGSYWADGEGTDQAGELQSQENLASESDYYFLQVVAHSSQMIYTRMIGDKEEDDKEAEGGVVVSFLKISSLWRRI